MTVRTTESRAQKNAEIRAGLGVVLDLRRVYASADSTKAGSVVLVAINRSASPQPTAIHGLPLAGAAHLYQMTAGTAQAQSAVIRVAAGTMAASGSRLTLQDVDVCERGKLRGPALHRRMKRTKK